MSRMLNIYLSEENGKLQEIDSIQKGCWINVLHPTEEEIQYLIETLNVELDFIRDPLDDEERSRIEKKKMIRRLLSWIFQLSVMVRMETPRMIQSQSV
ncbi:hypothetical protein GCM10020331_066150 [Ectobacillus funiculus]